MPHPAIHPPCLAAWLTRLCLHEVDAEAVLGDLDETYAALYRRYGQRAARRWYWSQTLRSAFPLLSRTCYWSFVMLKNYLKTALRTLLRHKSLSFINIFGLALGIAACILVFLYVRDEMSYDAFHEKGDRIYRVSIRQWDNMPYLPRLVGPTVEEQFPSVVRAVRFFDIDGRFVRRGDAMFREEVTFVDPGVFETFSFPLTAGDAGTALTDLNAVVLTEAMAQKYFGDANPLGETLAIRLFEDTYEDFTVTGVVGAFPGNSSITFDFLLPYEKYRSLVGEETYGSWQSYSGTTFVELTEQADPAALEARLSPTLARYAGRELAYGLDPLSRVYLRNTAGYSLVLSGIGLIVLMIACINFMTLTMGRATMRAREIGMRKVLGALRGQLARQFWGEALLMSFVALLLGVVLAWLFLPTFNQLAQKNLALNPASNLSTLAALAALVMLVGLVVGSYPALVLSRFHPAEVLRNKLRLGGGGTLTRALVILQFACSVGLITGTLVMARQLEYLRTKDLGWSQEQVVGIPASEALLEIFRNELATQPGILSLTGTSYTTNRVGTRGAEDFFLETGPDTLGVTHYRVDYHYLETLGIDLLAGRDFARERGTDATESTLVNETFVKAFGLTPETALGIQIGEATVIGVVQDFHFQSMHEAIPPLQINLHAYPVHYILARISAADVPATMAMIEETWQRVAPERPFDYFFLDEDIDRLYRTEERWQYIIQYASLVAILVACLGLFGLAMLTAARRTKEIGIRKVLGASVPRILSLLSQEFLKLVLVANAIAWPVAYLALQFWLRTFAYHIGMSVWTFLVAGLTALLVAFFAVSYQSIRAALINPVKTLRHE